MKETEPVEGLNIVTWRPKAVIAKPELTFIVGQRLDKYTPEATME
jgi:hypothetical protein